MASTKKKYTKDGRPFYEIRVHLSRDEPYHKTRWYVPEGWSEKRVQRELKKVAVNYENACRDGTALTRVQRAAQEASEVAEQAKIETLKQYAERIYLPSIRLNCSPNTISCYEGNLKRWIYPTLGNFKMPEITGAMISELYIKMQKKGLSHGSIEKVRNILSVLFRMAYLNDMIEKNPMDKAVLPKASKEEKKDGVEAYTEEQVKQIFEALSHEPLQWQVYVRLLLETGVRRGEACGLKWSDINMRTGDITISGSLNYTAEKGVYYGKPKNGHTRKVFIGQELLKMLKEYRKSQKVSGLYVFTMENGKPMFPTVPTRYFKRFSDRYSIPNFHPHILRHTFASLAVTNGADITSLSEELGHSDTAVTLRMYTHGNDESRRRVCQLVQSIIEG